MSRLLARLQRAELQRQADAAVRAALGEKESQPGSKASAGGDPIAMRGVPILGKGIGGAIKGTRPGDGLK